MYRYLVLLLSVIMLLVTFNPPASDWSIDFGFFGYRIHGNIFYWLFMVSFAAYLPLIAGGAILFLYDFTQALKTKKSRHVVNIFIFSTLTFVALYRFNAWIFGEIF
jgi:hypothetical protein